jgi:hypothetical protein
MSRASCPPWHEASARILIATIALRAKRTMRSGVASAVLAVDDRLCHSAAKFAVMHNAAFPQVMW